MIASGRPVHDWDSDRMRPFYGMLVRAERLGADVILGDWVPGIASSASRATTARYAHGRPRRARFGRP